MHSDPQSPGAGSLAHCLQFVAQRVPIPPFQAPLLPLTFACLNQVFQTPGPFGRRFATLCATLIPLHPKLVLPLPGNRQLRELIFNASSHVRLGWMIAMGQS